MNIIGRKKLWFSISLVLAIVGLVSILTWGLKLGIDFKGGTLLELGFKDKIEVAKIKEAAQELDFIQDDIMVVKTGEKSALIRSLPLEENQLQSLKDKLSQKVGESQEIRLETVGPTISNDLRKKAILAVIIASIVIVLYIAYAFKSVPKPANSWRFGVSAIIALLHDILIVVGAYSILGHFYGYEVDSLFITALLTIMGFSVHDTIVVFDRVRENLKRFPSRAFTQIVNDSVVQTLSRSLNTSLTLIIVLLALIFLGGDTIKPFIATLLIGVTIGTYSSIFNASPILVVWQNWKNR